jgi:putative oxygen-independent coproporphyrinogen III oxidase
MQDFCGNVRRRKERSQSPRAGLRGDGQWLFHVKQAAAERSLSRARPELAEEDQGFGLYLHWPFCESKCPYCDFNSHVTRQVDHLRWAAAFETEVARVGALTRGRQLRSVFFGGGTPSLMLPEIVARLMDTIRRTWVSAPDLEVTLEANPTSVESERFRGFVQAGVNRFSIGVQALDDEALRALGRAHSAREALHAIETAKAMTDRVSFDLIYARQHQTRDAWRMELAQALALEPEHLSLYQLSIESGTAFGARHAAGRLPGLPDPDLCAELYEITQEECKNARLEAYEISNHARPGGESQHNLVYWRYGDYVGLGPGAHGRLSASGKRYAVRAETAPALWLAGVEAGRGNHEASDLLSAEDQAAEYLMMALRLREGASLARYRALAAKDLPRATVESLSNEGMVWQDGGRLGTTSQGRLLLNAILRELL